MISGMTASDGKSMIIAICSGNRKTITGHAGRNRSFLLFTIRDKEIADSRRVELDPEETFHEAGHRMPAPLTGISVLIAGGMGEGLFNRLKENGVDPVITEETDPETAVRNYLDGSIDRKTPESHSGGHLHLS